MEKEENKISEKKVSENEVEQNQSDNTDQLNPKEDNNQISQEKNSEDIILELEDKLARTFAEMENQRRRFEKEKEDAFEYGGITLAKEALSLIDNLERSKQILNNDETIKNTEALKKTLEHLDIIYKDLVSIFAKNNIKQIDSLNIKLNPNLLHSLFSDEIRLFCQRGHHVRFFSFLPKES